MNDSDLINELLAQPKARPQVQSVVTPPANETKQVIDSILGTSQSPVSGQQPNYDTTKTPRNALDYFNDRTGTGLERMSPSLQGLTKFILPNRKDKASQAMEALNTDEPDSVKEAKLKKIFPNIQIYTDNEKKSKYIVINGERLDLFTPGTEGYKTVPNIVFRENGQPIPVGDRVNKLRQYLTQKGSVNIGGAEVPTFDEKKLVDFDKNVVIGQDKYGNQTITFKKEMVLDDSGGVMSKLSDMFGTNKIAPGTYYLEKPVGVDFSKEGILNKMQGIGKFANDPENQLTMLGGGIGPGVVKSSIGMGVGATLGSGLKQRIETGEPADPLTALKSGGFAMGGGLVGGLAISGLSKMVNAALGKSVVNEAGMFRPEMMKDIMKQRGMSYEDMAQLIASKQKVKLNDAQMADLVTWLKTGNVPTAGQLINGKQGAIERELLQAKDPTTIKTLQGQTNQLEGNIAGMQGRPVPTNDPLSKAGNLGENSLRASGNEAIKTTNETYKMFRDSPGASTPLLVGDIRRRLNRLLSDESTKKYIPSEITVRLEKYGLSGNADKIKEMSVRDGAELVQTIEKLIRKTADTDKQYALKQIQGAIDKSMQDAFKADPGLKSIYDSAKKAYIEERQTFSPRGFKDKNPGLRGETKDTANFVQNVLEGKVPAEKFYEKFSNLSNDELKHTIGVLNKNRHGQETLKKLNDIRTNELMQTMKEANAKNGGVWDAKTFNNYVDSLGERAKYLFTPKQYQALMDMKKIDPAALGNEVPPTDWRNIYRKFFSAFGGKGPELLPLKRGVTFESSQFSINRGAKEAWKQLNGEGSNMPSVFGGGLFSRQLFGPDSR